MFLKGGGLTDYYCNDVPLVCLLEVVNKKMGRSIDFHVPVEVSLSNSHPGLVGRLYMIGHCKKERQQELRQVKTKD